MGNDITAAGSLIKDNQELIGTGFVSGRESLEFGKALHEKCPRNRQGKWHISQDRFQSVNLIFAQDTNRIPELVPIRHKRMAKSPFAFYRGAAIVMADDLSTTQNTGLIVQACGDAHISNFGIFRSPERNLVFDINDFDETSRGNWEWDLKRFLTSVEICGRDRGFTKDQRRESVYAGAKAYRESMLRFSEMSSIDVWYSQVQMSSLMQEFENRPDEEDTEMIRKTMSKAFAKNHEKAVAKFTEVKNGKRRFVNNPPLIIPIENLSLPSINASELNRTIRRFLVQYMQSLPRERRVLIEQYRILDIAAKVVGVGSVGTRCWIVLLEGTQENDYLILQLKEANTSVLEFRNNSIGQKSNGRRIVEGQRAIQTVGDIMLGWASFNEGADTWHDYYVRQLWDGKGSFDLTGISPGGLTRITELCAGVLAHAHAKTGNRHAIAGYLGKSNTHDEAMQSFAEAYADQNEIDYELFLKEAHLENMPN